MRRLLIALAIPLVLISGGCAASNASAEAGRDSQLNAILSLLAAEEHVASAEELARLGPATPDLLMRVAQDRELDIAHRARATSYLGYYQNNPKVEAFLSELLASPAPPTPLLRRGMLALAHASKGKAVGAISPHLRAQDALVREAAAQALAETGDAKALQMLHEAATREGEPFLQKKMHELAETAGEQKRKRDLEAPRTGTSDVQSTHY